MSWKDGIGLRNSLKEEKHLDLAMDLNQKGYKVWFFAVKVDAGGFVSKSPYTFMREIGLTSKARLKFMTRMSRSAEEASQWNHERPQIGFFIMRSQTNIMHEEAPLKLACGSQ